MDLPSLAFAVFPKRLKLSQHTLRIAGDVK